MKPWVEVCPQLSPVIMRSSWSAAAQLIVVDMG
jgi:hypothetical protein